MKRQPADPHPLANLAALLLCSAVAVGIVKAVLQFWGVMSR